MHEVTTTTAYKSCHDNNAYFHAFAKPNKIWIAGSKSYDIWPDCDLIINLNATNNPLVGVPPAPPPPPPKPLLAFSNKEWADLGKYILKAEEKKDKDKAAIEKKPDYIDVQWKDMGIPMLSSMFWIRLYEQVSEREKKLGEDQNYEILFTCMGGHGRTGTAMCCFLVGSRAYGPLEAIKYIRSNYCRNAVENLDQESYLWAVGAAIMKADGVSKEEIEDSQKKYKDWCNKNYSKSTSPPAQGNFGYAWKSTPSYGPQAKGSSSPQVWDYQTGKWTTQEELDKELYV